MVALNLTWEELFSRLELSSKENLDVRWVDRGLLF
jgi:hypothetical protein